MTFPPIVGKHCPLSQPFHTAEEMAENPQLTAKNKTPSPKEENYTTPLGGDYLGLVWWKKQFHMARRHNSYQNMWFHRYVCSWEWLYWNRTRFISHLQIRNKIGNSAFKKSAFFLWSKQSLLRKVSLSCIIYAHNED